MNFTPIQPPENISLFVKSIMVFEEVANQKTILPFFADGYPGLIFFESERGLAVYPQDKQMPVFFIYGQTLEPLELVFESNYRMIVFQFYPFILRSFFNIDPKSINDNCYNLLEHNDGSVAETLKNLQSGTTVEEKITLITNYLLAVFTEKKERLNDNLKQALLHIIENKGQISITQVCRVIDVNKRTFERRFVAETGLLPKQFAQIIQFHSSLEQLTDKDFDKLTDVVYENGFSDQSHFIKVFKAFTGRTPKSFSNV